MMPRSPGTERDNRERADQGPDDTLVLLEDAQWAYLQRRHELTPRERQIAELVCQGLKNDSIANRLRVRPETVKTHVRNIYRKVGVRSKIHMLLRFVREAANFSNRT